MRAMRFLLPAMLGALLPMSAMALDADKVEKAPNLDGVPGSDWPRELAKLCR